MSQSPKHPSNSKVEEFRKRFCQTLGRTNIEVTRNPSGFKVSIGFNPDHRRGVFLDSRVANIPYTGQSVSELVSECVAYKNKFESEQ